MRDPVINQRVSRRAVLVGAASFVLLAPVLTPAAQTARAASPKLTYGYGYTGGY